MEYVAFAILLGLAIGWRAAHLTIADECEKLGKFFVGRKVFECTAIKKCQLGTELNSVPQEANKVD